MREPRDDRRTSQGAAFARGFARKGAEFVARTCPTKSTVVQPHLSALSCAPITCTAALVPRAKERANLMPLSTNRVRIASHTQQPRGTVAARIAPYSRLLRQRTATTEGLYADERTSAVS